MVTLYHYTSRVGLEGIFRDGFIKVSDVIIGLDKEIRGRAVCLTSDSRPVGHGLFDGREISEEQASVIPVAREDRGRMFCLDHTRYRISIEIQEENRLIYVPDLLARWPALLFSMEVAGYFPCSVNQSHAELLGQYRALQEKGVAGKGHTWWYFPGDVPFAWFTEVGVRVGRYDYLSESPDIFLKLIDELDSARLNC